MFSDERWLWLIHHRRRSNLLLFIFDSFIRQLLTAAATHN
jgi:hypothetical protein